MGAGGSTAVGGPAGPAGAAASFDASGYDSDIEKQVGRKYENRREVVEKAEGGGQFLAVKPWAGAIFPPTGFDVTKANTSEPDDKLNLQWIYGYRGYDSQDNASYLANGDIVYPAAAAGIVYNKKKHSQRHFLAHDDDVICMARHPSGTLVATGEIGKDAKVILWNPETLEAVTKVTGFARAVTCIAFSSDGKRLAAVDMGENRTISVYEMKDNAAVKVASREAGPDPITAVKFNLADSNQLVTVAKNTATFWTVQGTTLTDKRGIVGAVATIQPQVALETLPGGGTVTGTANGQLYVWNGNNLAKAVQAHQGSIFAISATKTGSIWTAGKDGKIRKWDATMKPETTIDLRSIMSGLVDAQGRPLTYSAGKAPVAKSIFWQDGKLLVGTGTDELIEIDEKTSLGEIVAQGHSSGETWGLAVHPTDHVCVTAGEDNTLRTWDMDSRKQISLRILPAMGRSAAYSNDGKVVAVGMKNGAVIVLDATTLDEIKSWHDRKEMIGDLKFSPHNWILAVGSNDNFVDLYDMKRDYRRLATCTGHSSYITHMDFSVDGEVLRTNCGAYELLFWRTRTGEQLKEPSKLRDVKWATHTCILGWDVQGIWPKFANGTDINAVSLCHVGDTLATADDFGMVNLFRYPVAQPGASKYKRYRGHSAHVTCCRFTKDDSFLMTTGGGDKTLFQWEFVDENSVEEPEPEDIQRELDIDYEKNRAFHAPPEHATIEVPNAEYCALPPDASQGTPVEVQSLTGEAKEKGHPTLPGTWFMAIRPWLGAIFPPTNQAPAPAEKPTTSLALDFVYGYRGHDARENLHFLANGEIVYSAAGIGIVMHPDTRKQRFFLGHDDDIVSLTPHPDGKIVATGQVGKDPQIIVWDTTTMKPLHVLRGVHERAITSLGFSADGKRLLSVGMDNYHTIAIWDWEAGRCLATARGSTDKIFDVNFSPFDNDSFVSCGVKHAYFWSFKDGALKSNKGIMSTIGKIQTMHCMAFPSQGVSMMGTASGSVYAFRDAKLEWASPVVHPGGVTAIFCDKEGVITAGCDGLLKLWTVDGVKLVSRGEPIKIDAVMKQTAEKALSIRSISRQGDLVVLGTSSSEVLLVNLAKRDVVIAVQGLSTGEVWGLAAHPASHLFVTAAEDKSVRLWHADTNVQTAITKLPYMAYTAAWSPDGCLLAVGGDNGWVTILDAKLEKYAEIHDRKEDISALRFSPDGRRLAVGSHDNFIDVYNVPGFKKHGTCVGHASFIVCLDWSEDGKWLQSNCGAHELLFWDAETCLQETHASRLRDVKWATWTCILGWPVQGIWPRGANGTDINSVSRSHHGDLLCSADDFGMLKLFRYPAVNPGMPFNKYIGHSAHVTDVVWLNDDSHVLTAGGGDRCIFQWGVKS